MKDLIEPIKTILNNGWTQSNPAKSSLHFEEDEYNPVNPINQILIEMLPDRKDFITNGLHRVEQRARITIYVRPIDYQKTSLDTAKTIFRNMQTQIDTLLKAARYTVTGFREMHIEGWNDGNTVAKGRGVKQKIEPIQFRSSQVIVASYFDDVTPIVGALTNVTKIVFHKSSTDYTVYGVKELSFQDVNPYVYIAIPYGSMIHQHIKPSVVNIHATCVSYNSLMTALTNSSMYNTSTHVRAEADYVTVWAKDESGAEAKFKFENVHVENLGLEKLTEIVGVANWRLDLHANNGPIAVA